MKTYKIKAFSLCTEINFNIIAKHFGIETNYKWEELLTLSGKQLQGTIKNYEDKMVKIFPFGSIVFINMQYNEMMDVVNYLSRIEENLIEFDINYTDEYDLEMDTEKEFYLDFDKMICAEEKPNLDIASIILAKSVALERIEVEIEKLIDRSEELINILKGGNIKFKNRKLSIMTGDIMQFKHSTISYIMLLDKPDILWNNQKADDIYNELAHIFELEDRNKAVEAKTEALMDIIGVFTSLLQAKRGNLMEITVIILIAVEVVIMIINYFPFSGK